MGEEVQMSDCEKDVRGGDEERMLEWEVGLPNTDDLTPLSHYLISPELASAFSISPEPCKSMVDVNRASENALSSLRLQAQAFSLNKSLPSFKKIDDPLIVEEEEEDDPGRITKDGSDARKIRRLDITEEEDSALRMENSNEDYSSPALKRSRLVWTPQLHKRFVDVVGHLGIKNAVPKTIMQLMNVEGLTRENVASHLQKYRLYLKRMQGFEVPSSSDHLFASAPEPQSLQESSGTGNVNGTGTGTGTGNGNGNGNGQMQLPMPYAASFMPMQVMGMAHGHSHMGMAVGNPAAVAYHGYESHPYSMFKEQQGDWSGNKFGLAVSHPHVTPNDI